MRLKITTGIPGSGKTTWAEKFSRENGYVYLSSDKYRGLLGKDESDQTVNGQVFKILKINTEYFLRCGQSVLLDSCSINKKNRADFVKIGRKCLALVEAVVFQVPIEVAKTRNAARQRIVPDFVIDRQFEQFEMPTKEEFDKITIIE